MPRPPKEETFDKFLGDLEPHLKTMKVVRTAIVWDLLKDKWSYSFVSKSVRKAMDLMGEQKKVERIDKGVWKILLLFLLFSFSSHAQSITTDEIFTQLNTERQKRGMQQLAYVKKEQLKCNAWAVRIEKNLMHNSKDSYRGEVISEGLVGELIVPMFLKSKTHKKILLDRKAKGACVAMHYDKKEKVYYTVIRTYQ